MRLKMGKKDDGRDKEMRKRAWSLLDDGKTPGERCLNLLVVLGELLFSEKMAFVSRFSEGLADKMKDPITTISSSAQVCFHKFGLNDEITKHLEMILRNIEKVNRIIVSLHNNTRFDDLTLKECRIPRLLDGILSFVKDRCGEQEVSVKKRYSQDIPLVLADERLLREAFYNVIMNSLEAISEGGELLVEVEVNGGDVAVVVEDTGSGIPEKNIEKVFEPFFTTKREGTGLGLFLSYQIIKNHHGRIEIESNPGQGTRVTIKLPVAKKAKG